MDNLQKILTEQIELLNEYSKKCWSTDKIIAISKLILEIYCAMDNSSYCSKIYEDISTKREEVTNWVKDAIKN